MRTVLTAFVLLLSLVQAPTSEGARVDAPVPTQLDDHEPIRIVGDDDLEPDPVEGLPVVGHEPTNGVRSGAGTADDPFVIADWRIRFGDAAGALWIMGTTKHLRIQRLELVSEQPIDKGLPAIRLENVANVAIERVTFQGAIAMAVLADDSRGLRLGHLFLDEDEWIQLGHVQAASLHDLRFEGPGASLWWHSSTGAISNSSFLQTTDDGLGEFPQGISANGLRVGCASGDQSPATSRVTIADSTFASYEAPEGHGILVSCSGEVVGRRLTLEGNYAGLGVHSGFVMLADSAIRNNDRGVSIDEIYWPGEQPWCECKITESIFSENRIHVQNDGSTPVTAEHNTWDNGGRPASGTILGTVDYEPWKNGAKESPTLNTVWLLATILAFLASAVIARTLSRAVGVAPRPRPKPAKATPAAPLSHRRRSTD